MRGRMLWFNGEKDLGAIEGEDGERFTVYGHDFAAGAKPDGRCGGTEVAFRLFETDDRRAADVTLVAQADPRRARRRHGRSFS